MWTVNEIQSADVRARAAIRKVGTFPTKREAHNAVLAGLRGMKGYVLRWGHSYTYTKPKK